MPEDQAGSAEWLDSRAGGIGAATKLMPFAGISFRWFIRVIRDGLGRYEDKFFSSVFLGSGLLFLAMMFVSTSVAAGLVASNGQVADAAAQAATVDFGKMGGVGGQQDVRGADGGGVHDVAGGDLAADGLDASLARWAELPGRHRRSGGQ